MADRSKIIVIGAARGIGHWFVERFLSEFTTAFDVFACDVNFDDSLAISEKVQIVDVSNGFDDLGDLVNSRDVVVFAVPIDVLHECTSAAAEFLDSRITVINFCSAQHETNQIIKKNLSDKCEVVGLHLMFGPGATSVLGQNFILTDASFPLKNRELKWLVGTLTSNGAFIEYSTSDLHDRMMNVMQALVHFTYISFGRFLKDNDIGLRDILKFQTLPSAYFFSFVTRVLLQDKRTYANIQMKNGAKEARQEFLASARAFADDIDQSEGVNDLVSSLDSLSEHFSKDDLESVYNMTETSIVAFDGDARQIQDLISSSSLVAVNCGADEGVAVGQIVEQNKESFTLRKSSF